MNKFKKDILHDLIVYIALVVLAILLAGPNYQKHFYIEFISICISLIHIVSIYFIYVTYKKIYMKNIISEIGENDKKYFYGLVVRSMLNIVIPLSVSYSLYEIYKETDIYNIGEVIKQSLYIFSIICLSVSYVILIVVNNTKIHRLVLQIFFGIITILGFVLISNIYLSIYSSNHDMVALTTVYIITAIIFLIVSGLVFDNRTVENLDNKYISKLINGCIISINCILFINVFMAILVGASVGV